MAAAELREPGGVEFNAAGDAFIIEMANGHRPLRLATKTGVLTHVAGQSNPSNSGDDGPAGSSRTRPPHGVTVHRDGTLYITDSYNDRILKIGP